MTGGVREKPRRRALHRRGARACRCTCRSDPQIAGALGAALLALDDFRAENKAELALLDDDHLEQQMGVERACAPGCKGVPALAPEPTPAQSKVKALWDHLQNHI